MEIDIPDQQKKEILNRLLKSQTLADSKICQELLTFLVHSSLNRTEINESSIAKLVYKKGADFNSSVDTSIRASVYRLRKKLRDYFGGEGKNEKIQLNIPRGHYFIEFVPKTSPSAFYTHPFWFDFTIREKPAYVVCGDLFTYQEYDSKLKRTRYIWDPEISSSTDFENLLRTHPDLKVNNLDRSYLDSSFFQNIMKISPIFLNNEHKYICKLASELSWEDIAEKDIFFLGEFNTLYNLDIIFEQLNLKFTSKDRIIKYSETGDILSVFDFQIKTKYQETISLILKVPGPAQNIIFLILGNGYPPLNFTVNKLTEYSFLEELNGLFKNRSQDKLEYFSVLLKIKGLPSIGFKYEFLDYQIIETDSFDWEHK